MNIADQVIAKMRGPRNMHIICVDVTNKCDLACSNCTRLLENQTGFWDITPDNFRLALRSLAGYHGIIAMIGGNPCMHKNFEELCEIFVEEVPNKFQRGLWTNNVFKHGELALETFGTFNINTHGNYRAESMMIDFAKDAKARGALVWAYTGYSDHSPLLTAIKDIYPEQEMWEKIGNCDINKEWSASVVQNQGELRVYFCEVAAAFDLANGADNGMPAQVGWWQRPITDFSEQVKKFCPNCGVPAKLKGSKDFEETDTYTKSNEDIARKNPKRKVIMLEHAESKSGRVTLYNQNML
jgi:hypothetical protein